MSVFVLEFTSPTAWVVTHDDHVSTVDPASIQHTTNMDGSTNWDFMIVECPVCHAVSTHPVGGGSNPVSVQTMFVKAAERDGCCGDVMRSTADAETHVKDHVVAMDGEGRWQLDQVSVA